MSSSPSTIVDGPCLVFFLHDVNAPVAAKVGEIKLDLLESDALELEDAGKDRVNEMIRGLLKDV